jgi:hypothetical protein
LLTLLLVLGSLALSYVSFFEAFSDFTWLCLLFFFMITFLILATSTYVAKSGGRYNFIGLVSASVVGKLLLSACLIAGYFWMAKPQNGYFIISFFALYLVYSIFEIRQLIKILDVSRQKST